MTRTIERDVRIERGRVVIELPPDIPDGPAHVILQLGPAPTRPSGGADWIAELEPIGPQGWPTDATFGREELYGEDGR